VILNNYNNNNKNNNIHIDRYIIITISNLIRLINPIVGFWSDRPTAYSACTIWPLSSAHKCTGKRSICRKIRGRCSPGRTPFRWETLSGSCSDSTSRQSTARHLCRNRTACIPDSGTTLVQNWNSEATRKWRVCP